MPNVAKLDSEIPDEYRSHETGPAITSLKECKYKPNRIYCRDACRFMSAIPNESIDLVIMDPPYNMKVAEWDDYSEKNRDFMYYMHLWLNHATRVLKPNGSIYVFNTPYNSFWIGYHFIFGLDMKFRNWIVWDKRDGMSGSKNKYVCKQEVILFFTKSDKHIFNYDAIRVPYEHEERVKYGVVKKGKKWMPNPDGKLCTDVWDFTSERFSNRNRSGNRLKKMKHPTPKPLEMIERMVKASSNKGDIVLDPFMGSGTTAIAAKLHGRRFMGCDSSKEYVKYSFQRYKEFFLSNTKTERLL